MVRSSITGHDVVGGLLIAVVVAAFVFLVGAIAGYKLASDAYKVTVKGETPICRLLE